MEGFPIAALNEGLRAFSEDIRGDVLARHRAEIAVVTFGGAVSTAQDFVSAGAFAPPVLTAGGDTPMGAGILRAIDLIEQRKREYREFGIEYYRPWILLISDGAPTDDWQLAAERVHAAEAANELAFFPIGVEGANIEILDRISVRSPLTLTGLRFMELMIWLSRSQQVVSAGRLDEQAPLPAVDGWASADWLDEQTPLPAVDGWTSV
jgi:uncharacterized protein YegL